MPGGRLPESFEHPPYPYGAHDGYDDVIVQSKDVHGLTRAGDHARYEAHHGERPSSCDSHSRQAQGPVPHDGVHGVVVPAGRIRDDVSPECGGGCRADEEAGQTPRQALSAADSRRVATPSATDGGRGGVAPGKQQYRQGRHVLWEHAEHRDAADEVPDDAVPGRHLALAHQRAQQANVQRVDGRGIEP